MAKIDDIRNVLGVCGHWSSAPSCCGNALQVGSDDQSSGRDSSTQFTFVR